MFFISPVAENSLAYSNILAEWLSSTKQNKVYIPEEPFPHANLVKNARLKFFKHVFSENFSSEFRQVRFSTNNNVNNLNHSTFSLASSSLDTQACASETSFT